MTCDHCHEPQSALILVEELDDAKLCYNCLDKLSRAAPALFAALEELLAARDMQRRIILWLHIFPHLTQSMIVPESAARKRFSAWNIRATDRINEAEEAARAAIARARGERSP